jgi:protein SCO1/2
MKIKITQVLFILIMLAHFVIGQGQQHYNSPLYAPRDYVPSESLGVPQVLKEIGIEQKLGQKIPLDIEFKDEEGRIVKIGDYFNKNKPVILALVYYECPMLCNEVLNGLTGSLKGISLTAGKDFEVVAISFNSKEYDIPELAKKKKEAYVKRYDRAGTEQGWHFLTGTQDSIDKITDAIGFKYRWDEKTQQFAHVGGITVLDPSGQISKYFYGIDYAPTDLKFALIEASEGKVGSVADQLLLYCYHYDPSTGTYGFAILRAIRIGGLLTLLAIVGMFIYFRKKKKFLK